MDVAEHPKDAGHVRNCWYMAGWDRDIVAGTPKGERFLGEPIVLYRKPDGQVVALADRCFHRLAPLSLGKCEGANLRCMYHGLMYAPDGSCVEVPGQKIVPAAVRVRAYPVIEKHSAIWIWMGDPALADAALIPDFVGYHSPDWAIEPDRLDYAAPAKLIHDNLLDLSHVGFVHFNTLSAGSPEAAMMWVNAETKYETLPRGVRVSRLMKNMPLRIPGERPAEGQTALVDFWTSYQFLVPGIFLQRSDRYRPGSYSLSEAGEPVGKPAFSTFTCQAVTPLTEDSACYFFAFGPWVAQAALKQQFAALGAAAFAEDRRMIEAQQRNILLDRSVRMMPMAMDKAVRLYEGVVKRLLREEVA